MKLNQSFILGMVIAVLALVQDRAEARSQFATDFNDQTPQSWVASVTAGSTPTTLSVLGGDPEQGTLPGRYVLQLDDSAATGSTYATLSRSFTAQTDGSFDITFRIRFLETGTNPTKGDWRVALIGNAGSIYLRMKMSGTGAGFSHYDSPTNTFVPSNITSIVAGNWYEVRISGNLVEKTYGWTVRNLSSENANQKARVENLPFYQNASSISALAFVSVQRGGKFQLDDVRVNGFRNNIAKTRPYTLSPAPNYPLCTEAGDATQLTDGSKRVPGFISPSLWTLPECVGWVNAAIPMSVFVDLGCIKPISGFSINMCAGTSASVAWPAHVMAYVSDDANEWHFMSELVYEGEVAGDILSDGRWKELNTRVHKFGSDVQTHGQFVCFMIIPSSAYVFLDEVEVFEGNSNWTSLTLPEPIFSGTVAVKADALNARNQRGLLKRIKLDENELNKQIETSILTDPQKVALKSQLTLAADAARGTAVPTNLETRIPLNVKHGEMIAVQGALWTSRGVLQPTVWRNHRFQWLDFFQTPPITSDVSALSTSLLKNEVRGDTVLISNPTNEPLQVELTVENIRGNYDWLKIYQGAWTDTFQRVVISSALEEVVPINDTYTMTVPPGMTSRVWLQVDGHELTDNSYNSSLTFQMGSTQTVVPWNIRVSLMSLDEPRLTTFMWDFMNGSGYLGLNDVNRPEALSLMKSHLVNSVWGRSVLPTCTAADFNSSDQLIGTLNFTAFDNWVLSQCPGAKRYYIFLGNPGTELGGSTFAGAHMTSAAAAFNKRVGAWAHAIASHIVDLDLDPEQFSILVWDEPRAVWQFGITKRWLEAIKAGDSRLQAFIDPKIDSTISPSVYADTIALADVICPYTYTYAAAGATLRQYYRAQWEDHGKELFFYLSASPAKLSDPTHYYRQHPWYIFLNRGLGMGFWSIADTGGAPTSWNEYMSTRDNYSPIYISSNSVTTSVHFEALREGVEDNELFYRLEALAENGAGDIPSRWAALKSRISSQTGSFTSSPRWPQNIAPDNADVIRRDAIQLLENASGLSAP